MSEQVSDLLTPSLTTSSSRPYYQGTCHSLTHWFKWNLSELSETPKLATTEWPGSFGREEPEQQVHKLYCSYCHGNVRISGGTLQQEAEWLSLNPLIGKHAPLLARLCGHSCLKILNAWQILSGVGLLNFLLRHSLLEQFQILNSSAPNLQLFIEASSSAPVFICWRRFCSFFYHRPQWLSAMFPVDTSCLTSVDSHPLRSCTSPFAVYTTNSQRKCPSIVPQ